MGLKSVQKMKDNPFLENESEHEDIIYRTENFFVKVGVGLAAPGHIMLITKKPYKCFADIPQELDEEYESIKSRLVTVIRNTFSEPFLIEYGVWGQTVAHAHIHFIPLRGAEYQVRSIIEEMVRPGNITIEMVTGLTDVRRIYKKEKGYLFIEEFGKQYVCHVSKIVYDINNRNPHLSYRLFFEKRGVKAVGRWDQLSPTDKLFDEVKKQETIERLKKPLNEKTD